MQSNDSPQTVHFVPLPPVASLAKVPAWQLVLDTIGLFRILLLLGTRCCHCPSPHHRHPPPSVPLPLPCISLTAAHNKQWVLTAVAAFCCSIYWARSSLSLIVWVLVDVVASWVAITVAVAIVSTKKIKVKHYCYNMLLITKLRVFLTFLALKWIVKI